MEIRRLLEAARQHGRPDDYVGRRRWTRYLLGMPLEVTIAPDTPGASRTVRMHNVSGGGLGFWSDHEFPIGLQIHVREHQDKEQPGVWLSGTVRYCALGMRGYLVGMVFEQPAPPEVGVLPMQPAWPVCRRGDLRARSVRERFSLATQCSLISMTSVLMGLGAAWVLSHSPSSLLREARWVPLATVLTGTVLAGLASWGLVAGQSRLLRAIQKAIAAMARGEMLDRPLPPARCNDVWLLRKTVLDLGSRWRSHEDNERTERRRLEELSQIKSNILSMVSHDLRTPLTSILLYSRMLQEDLEGLTREDERHFLSIITDECTRLTRMVDDLLDVQRLESGSIAWNTAAHDLAQTVRACDDVFRPIAEANGIRFSVFCPRSLPIAQVEPDRISQVLSNLLSNAMKYTPSGGEVELTAEASDSQIMLRVRDNGPGIPRDKWDQIFERFTQLGGEQAREISGVGLGLYIVRQIVERHGGSVWVDSEVGRGAEFCVSLPVDQTGAQALPEPPDAEQTCTVLVCDADPELASTVARLARGRGLTTRVVHSARRLLELVRQGSVDVVLTDIQLPDSDAVDVLSGLLDAENRRFRVVIHSYEGDRRELRRSGADVVLRRPASEEEIILALLTAVHKRSPDRRIALVPRSDTPAVSGLFKSLAEAGYMIVAQADFEAIGPIAPIYPVDLVLAWGPDLGLGWGGLKKLGWDRYGRIPAVVLCEDVGRDERRLADRHGVTALLYEQGREEQVLLELANLAGEQSLEAIS